MTMRILLILCLLAAPALGAEPIEVEVEVTPSTQPADVAGDTAAERDAAYVPPKVTVKQRIEPPSTEEINKWRDAVLAVLAAFVAILTFILAMVVPLILKIRDSSSKTEAKIEEVKTATTHRIDRMADVQNQQLIREGTGSGSPPTI